MGTFAISMAAVGLVLSACSTQAQDQVNATSSTSSTSSSGATTEPRSGTSSARSSSTTESTTEPEATTSSTPAPSSTTTATPSPSTTTSTLPQTSGDWHAYCNPETTPEPDKATRDENCASYFGVEDHPYRQSGDMPETEREWARYCDPSNTNVSQADKDANCAPGGARDDAFPDQPHHDSQAQEPVDCTGMDYEEWSVANCKTQSWEDLETVDPDMRGIEQLCAFPEQLSPEEEELCLGVDTYNP